MKYIPNHQETLRKIIPPIQHVWEVKIHPEIWQKIAFFAQKNKVTYSWIVRFCIFSEISPANRVTLGGENHTVNNEISKKDYHRHKLCLYGEDEKLLRMSAMEKGITVSAYIRLCLDRYLANLADVEFAVLFSKGIKFGKKLRMIRHSRCGFPSLIMHQVIKFQKKDWWKVPSEAKILFAE